jgi:copper chaperone
MFRPKCERAVVRNEWQGLSVSEEGVNRMTATFEAHCPTIECDGCAASIRRTLGKLAGVQQVTVEVEAKNVLVQFDPNEVGVPALRERLIKAGFEPDPERAQ